jgi:diguanylate cyclase (GGDEF)-like protein/PAS domain S-box-containing protein
LWLPREVWESQNPLTRLIALVALFGFFSYLILMRRTLRYLDPLAVIPPRVQATLDALTEGVILMDKQERIVLVNTAFAHKVGQSVTALLGQKASALNWKVPKSGHSISDYPWLKALHTGQKQTGFLMALTTDANELCTFVVNGSPIFDEAGNSRGALATFDDVTELEAKNEQLMFLATRDPLTGCLNRRALFEQIETDFAAAQSKGLDLSCIMCDIDHFKDVNDYYGHATGDQVLKSMVTALQAMLGQDAAIGRYGGEEFSILLKGVSIEQAAQLAEQCRSLIEDQISAGIRITASFGVSSTGSGAGNTQELLSQADKCLYAAKHSGRNRVIRWDDETTKPSMRPTTSFTRSVNRK